MQLLLLPEQLSAKSSRPTERNTNTHTLYFFIKFTMMDCQRAPVYSKNHQTMYEKLPQRQYMAERNLEIP